LLSLVLSMRLTRIERGLEDRSRRSATPPPGPTASGGPSL
jgi:hypothetical protein